VITLRTAVDTDHVANAIASRFETTGASLQACFEVSSHPLKEAPKDSQENLPKSETIRLGKRHVG
jgi:hypothetical protein